MRYYVVNPLFPRVFVAAVADALCMAGAAGITWLVQAPQFDAVTYTATTMLAATAAFVALFYADAYRPSVLADSAKTLTSIFVTMAMAFAVAIFVYFAVHTSAGVVPMLAHISALYFPALIAERALFRTVSAMPRFSRRVLIVGVSDLSLAIARQIQSNRRLGLDLVGYLSDDLETGGRLFEAAPVIGKTHELEKMVDEHGIGIIVVASKSRREHFPADALLAAKLAGRTVEAGVSFYERITGRIYLRDLRESYLIFGNGYRISSATTVFKRAVDVSLATIGLLLSAPLLAMCAVAIKLDSRGPVFYRQERVGQGGKTFRICKLRSMRAEAERETGPVWADKADARVTRVGNFLRRCRVDEVPQLWNVLVGEMSMVGPRPERPEFVEELTERYPYFRLRNAVKPGVTGWAQIRDGYVGDVEGVEGKLELDLYYLKWCSIGLDAMILWHTAKTVVLLRGR